jgi:hypothetical protein
VKRHKIIIEIQVDLSDQTNSSDLDKFYVKIKNHIICLTGLWLEVLQFYNFQAFTIVAVILTLLLMISKSILKSAPKQSETLGMPSEDLPKLMRGLSG